MKTSAATTDGSNLIFDAEEVAAARAVAILIPGAFCRLSMFEPAGGWRSSGYALVHYRFPGLDGRPLHPPLDIGAAAAEIAQFAATCVQKGRLRLVGYSTGAAIAVEAAARMAEIPPMALMSPVVPRGGGPETALRASRDLASAALRAGSLRLEPVWLEYYRVLLFGREVLADPALAERARAIIAARRERIVLPVAALRRAHTAALRRWRPSDDARFRPGHVRIYRGAQDSVFSRAQTARFAARLGPAEVLSCPGHGHLLFASRPETFDEIRVFLEGEAAG